MVLFRARAEVSSRSENRELEADARGKGIPFNLQLNFRRLGHRIVVSHHGLLEAHIARLALSVSGTTVAYPWLEVGGRCLNDELG
jgi:hypothetical protein